MLCLLASLPQVGYADPLNPPICFGSAEAVRNKAYKVKKVESDQYSADGVVSLKIFQFEGGAYQLLIFGDNKVSSSSEPDPIIAALSPIGDIYARTTENSLFVDIYDRKNSIKIQSVQVPAPVKALRISPNGDYLAVATENELILEPLSPSRSGLILPIRKGTTYIGHLDFSPSGRFVVLSTLEGGKGKGEEGTCRTWIADLKSGQLPSLKHLFDCSKATRQVRYSVDETWVTGGVASEFVASRGSAVFDPKTSLAIPMHPQILKDGVIYSPGIDFSIGVGRSDGSIALYSSLQSAEPFQKFVRQDSRLWDLYSPSPSIWISEGYRRVSILHDQYSREIWGFPANSLGYLPTSYLRASGGIGFLRVTNARGDMGTIEVRSGCVSEKVKIPETPEKKTAENLDWFEKLKNFAKKIPQHYACIQEDDLKLQDLSDAYHSTFEKSSPTSEDAKFAFNLFQSVTPDEAQIPWVIGFLESDWSLKYPRQMLRILSKLSRRHAEFAGIAERYHDRILEMARKVREQWETGDLEPVCGIKDDQDNYGDVSQPPWTGIKSTARILHLTEKLVINLSDRALWQDMAMASIRESVSIRLGIDASVLRPYIDSALAPYFYEIAIKHPTRVVGTLEVINGSHRIYVIGSPDISPHGRDFSPSEKDFFEKFGFNAIELAVPPLELKTRADSKELRSQPFTISWEEKGKTQTQTLVASQQYASVSREGSPDYVGMKKDGIITTLIAFSTNHPVGSILEYADNYEKFFLSLGFKKEKSLGLLDGKNYIKRLIESGEVDIFYKDAHTGDVEFLDGYEEGSVVFYSKTQADGTEERIQILVPARQESGARAVTFTITNTEAKKMFSSRRDNGGNALLYLDLRCSSAMGAKDRLLTIASDLYTPVITTGGMAAFNYTSGNATAVILRELHNRSSYEAMRERLKVEAPEDGRVIFPDDDYLDSQGLRSAASDLRIEVLSK